MLASVGYFNSLSRCYSNLSTYPPNFLYKFGRDGSSVVLSIFFLEISRALCALLEPLGHSHFLIQTGSILPLISTVIATRAGFSLWLNILEIEISH